MKKNKYLFLIALLIAISLIACSSDATKDEEPSPPQEIETDKDISKPQTKLPIELKEKNPLAKTTLSSDALLVGGNGTQYKRRDMNEFGYPNVIVHNTEEYDRIYENEFKSVVDNPLSTFSIDVDAASYGNVRRFINSNNLPPADAVRIEELINYFDYDYPQPISNDPFSIITEVSECPWNKTNRLVHIGLQGRKVSMENLPPSNLVFLIDVSGSMRSPNKLPLLKKAFKLLISQLRPEDKISMTVYASASGVVLPPTSGSQKEEIIKALEKLESGGSTAGSEGIKLAYKVAKQNFIEGANNRVILATDGDFNVGPSSDSELVRLIEERRKDGIFLTVLGFGMGNYKDSKMEKLADNGNGNYAYIDNLLEAKKVLVNEFGGTLFTIAKDVKLQIEFNPTKVKGYRLIGYENRLLKKEDFNDDTKDAGEIGSGHTVTALYEIIPPEADFVFQDVDELKYQSVNKKLDVNSKELLTVKFRYKKPDEDESKLIVRVLNDESIDFAATSENFRFSSSVAMFGMLLRESKFKGNSNYEKAIAIAKAAIGKDIFGYQSEYLKIVEKAKLLAEVDEISMRVE